MKTCSVVGCGRKHNAHGYCLPHYKRLHKTGKLNPARPIGFGKYKTYREMLDVFWSYVQKQEGCWKWIGPKASGYGRFSLCGKRVFSHRFSWEIHNGKIPNHLGVLHKCDNPECTNPEHLFLGTQKENRQDQIAKKRFVGEQCTSAKLTSENVMKIKKEYVYGLVTHLELAHKYGVAESTIWAVLNHKIWKHL